jgi:hypothetical protein
MCHQVSDGETWQEYLAAHLGEPIRNFGVGGYGVYQAYRRMVRTELAEIGASHVILNIWGIDDHYRSLDTWRYLRCPGWIDMAGMFHANPWDHLSVDLDTGRISERKNICPTPESLYNLCDRDFVYETFKDDVALNLHLGGLGQWQINQALLQRLAEALGVPADLGTTDQQPRAVRKLQWETARRGTAYVLDRTRVFCREHGKKLLVLLSYSSRMVADACSGQLRRDEDLLETLRKMEIPFVDVLEKHVKDYQVFRLTAEEYTKRYYNGHYSPRGNHFFAFAIKDELVAWLDPQPPAYEPGGRPRRLETYLRSQ